MYGKIIKNISNTYYVEVEGKIYKCIARGKFKNKEIEPTVGDIVDIMVIDQEKEEAVIEKIEKRNTYLKRPKIANITQIICVISSKNPKPDLLMLDKQLAFAEFIGIKPIIVINKIDLETEGQMKRIKDIYINIGYEVIQTTASEGIGIEKIKKLLINNISVFSGNSGVGKSTLLNSIFEEKLSDEGDISKKNKKGKNTTTNISLFKIEKDTYIADTPGFSTFDIDEIPSKDVANYFVEFKKYINECRYLGCSHIKEKDCGVKKALEEGYISKERYNNFVKVYSDIKDKEEHRW